MTGRAHTAQNVELLALFRATLHLKIDDVGIVRVHVHGVNTSLPRYILIFFWNMPLEEFILD